MCLVSSWYRTQCLRNKIHKKDRVNEIQGYTCKAKSSIIGHYRNQLINTMSILNFKNKYNLDLPCLCETDCWATAELQHSSSVRTGAGCGWPQVGLAAKPSQGFQFENVTLHTDLSLSGKWLWWFESSRLVIRIKEKEQSLQTHAWLVQCQRTALPCGTQLCF